jgi:hypothetical protein
MTRDGNLIDMLERAGAHVMRTHHGLLTLEQALLLGWTAGMVKRRLEAGEWRALLPGVYCAAATPPSVHQRVLAGVLAPHVPALASHRAGA